MAEQNEIINVQLEKRTLPLGLVGMDMAEFGDHHGYNYTMPRRMWMEKGRPTGVIVSVEVTL
ncbi:hypothetical protein SEA_PLATTE_9 [Microbacterium phage Platte]|nr:hypothetical protein SEA_TANDEM_9 [Microbacterium phage Tandem]QZD97605.1 hypothetical protein SEA_PLATTE_9 [Microbacterium phage Platte]